MTEAQPSIRGTGITTKQILNAPKDAIFIWVNDSLFYPRNLAISLNRADIEIHPPSFLSYHRLKGNLREIVIDHAAFFSLTESQFDSYQRHQNWIKSRGK